MSIDYSVWKQPKKHGKKDIDFALYLRRYEFFITNKLMTVSLCSKIIWGQENIWDHRVNLNLNKMYAVWKTSYGKHCFSFLMS